MNHFNTPNGIHGIFVVFIVFFFVSLACQYITAEYDAFVEFRECICNSISLAVVHSPVISLQIDNVHKKDQKFVCMSCKCYCIGYDMANGHWSNGFLVIIKYLVHATGWHFSVIYAKGVVLGVKNLSNSDNMKKTKAENGTSLI